MEFCLESGSTWSKASNKRLITLITKTICFPCVLIPEASVPALCRCTVLILRECSQFLAQAACVRHACLRAPCVAWPLLLPLFSLSLSPLFFLRLLLLIHFCYWYQQLWTAENTCNRFFIACRNIGYTLKTYTSKNNLNEATSRASKLFYGWYSMHITLQVS